MSNVVELRPKVKKGWGPETKIGCIIQARMTSKRFPGKVLALLDGKPVVQHVIERCKSIRAPKRVISPIKLIVAVPDTPESEPLLNLVTDELGIDNYCGPELNVLERYYGAATYFNLDIIIRITADCPLIDPYIVSEVLQLLMWRKVDYASNCHEQRTYPKGLDCEVFTFECLEATYVTVMENYKYYTTTPKLANYRQEIEQCLYDMEHVTPLMKRHPSIKRALVKRLKGNDSRKDWCVDVPSDIEKLEKLIATIKPPRKVPITDEMIITVKASNENVRPA